MELKEAAKKLMISNFEATGRKYITPSWPHYRNQWLWDSCFHAIICANLGLKDLAKNEIEQLLAYQREDGFIPHRIYHGIRSSWDLERMFYKSIVNKVSSSITQPPVLAQAVEAIDDPEWAREIMPKVIKFYIYYKEKQDPDGDSLISICHPCESGRNASPEFDFLYWKHSKLFPFLNPAIRLAKILNMERKYRKLDWDIARIWEADLFNVEDLMTHCIWVQGLRSLARLVRKIYGYDKMDLILKLQNLADDGEKAVFNLCWDEKEKIFRSLDSKNRPIVNHLTISNLYPIILDNIPKEMISAIVANHVLNPKEFWTPYPIPTVSISDSAFDTKSEWLLWRGPVWINMNWFIIQGLRKHGYNDIAEKISTKTKEMVEREGFREFYNPFTGKGMRVKKFGWSGLAALM